MIFAQTSSWLNPTQSMVTSAYCRFDILSGLKAEDSRIRLYSCSEPLQILFADAAEMFATFPIHGLMQTTWYVSR